MPTIIAPQCEQLEERLALALFNVQPPLSFTGLNNNSCVAVSDFNKDGLADAALTNFGADLGGGAGNSITVLYGRSVGGFNRVQLATGGTNPSFVGIADINGDSFPDLVASNVNGENLGSVSVFRNDGAGNLSRVGTPFSTFGNNPSWVGLADLTGDFVLDVVVANRGRENGPGNIVGNNVTIFRGDTDFLGRGNFTFSATPFNLLSPDSRFTPYGLAVADFNGDGLNDVAAAVPSMPSPLEGNVYVFRGTSGGTFAAHIQYASGGSVPVDVKAANLNGDNKPDLVVANAGDPNANPEFSGDAVGLLFNASNGPFNVSFGPTTSLTANTHGPFAVAVDDFNLDNKADIAAVNHGALFFPSPAAFVSVYLGNGAGAFTPDAQGRYDTRSNTGGGQYLAVGDFDANQTPDLIVAHSSNLVGLLLNTTVPGPRVLASHFTYDTAPQRLTFRFDQDVLLSLGLDDITIQRIGAGGGTITPAGVSFDTNTNTATVTFSGVLADGNYRATLNASGITNFGGTPMAANYVLDFFFLNADANRDRKVDFGDLVILAQNYGMTAKTFSTGDFNYDTRVEFSDLVLLAQRYNNTLPAAALEPAPAPAATTTLAERRITGIFNAVTPAVSPRRASPKGTSVPR